MSPRPIPFDTDELLAQIGWVRTIARQVAADAHVADDLTQDAMLVALRGRTSSKERGPHTERSPCLRRWLAAVVRNLGRARHRSERRRAKREAVVANQDLPPATVELIERAAMQREIVDAVLELDEPYRSTLLMRFFEEYSHREIAERTGVPVSTVGTRIAEGLKRLRRRFRPRDTWISSILALVFRRPRADILPALTHGFVLVTVQTKLILGTIVLIGALVALQVAFPGMGPGVPDTLQPGSEPRDETASVGAPIETQRQVIEVETPPRVGTRPAGFFDIPEHAGIVRAGVHGRVIDVAGNPVSGIEVCRIRPSGSIGRTGKVVPAQSRGSVTTDASGRFETEGDLPFALSVQDDEYTTLFEGTVNRAVSQEILVVVARRIPLGGIVVDEDGKPLAGVRVTVEANIAPLGRDLSASRLVIPQVHTDQRGVFVFEDAGAVEGSRVQFLASGFVMQFLAVPANGDRVMRIVMSRAVEDIYTITGRVVLEDGSPAVGAYVSTGAMASRTDGQGSFVIDFEPWLNARVDENLPTVLTAIQPGLMPTSLTLPSVHDARKSGWPRTIVLKLAGKPLTMRGSVVDEKGDPVSGVLVEPTDMSAFGLVAADNISAFGGIPKSQEQLAGGGEVYTGDDGHFELKGLLDRTYSIRALRKPSLLCVVSDPINAGDQDVRIVLDRSVLGTIEGRIVDGRGQGIGDVRVAVSRKRIGELVIGSSALTDEDGAFKITNVTKKPSFLRIEGNTIVPELFRKLDASDDVSDLELEVGRRQRVQFDWSNWSGPKARLEVVGARDKPLMMMRLAGNGISEVRSVDSQQGVSSVLVVSDAAVCVIIYCKGKEAARVRLNLIQDQLNLIRL